MTRALVVALIAAACTPAQETSSAPPTPVSASPSPGVSSSPSSSPSTEIDTSANTVRIDAPPGGGSLLVVGTYPKVESRCVGAEQPQLKARYPGRLTVERVDDGTLTLTATVPFDTYLEGIAEVPPSWPMAALQAQAIAARSYALASTGWLGEPGETLDEPICATTSCQVYRGIPLGKQGIWQRWFDAVRLTDGLVLLHDGRPATTFYFSTSNGRTYGNEEVFGGTPLPYLRGAVENDDSASPTSKWQTKIRLKDLARFLASGGLWPEGTGIANVAGDGGEIIVRGGGETRAIDGSSFREAVNTWAPCLMPRIYPTGALPTTIPSRWMTARTEGEAMIATGRGWGHGVGMVQWGAYGKARRGLSAAQILAAYYGGYRAKEILEPEEIQVQIADGLTSLRVSPSASGASVNGERIRMRPVTIEA